MRALTWKASWLSFLLVVFTSFGLFAVSNVSAEEDGSLKPEDCIEGDLRRKCQVDEITVTGSRLKRDTFSSIAPLQVITGQISRESGLIDAADILQESTAATGQQIDLSFSGFVVDNGPGAETLNLRGLGDARTLILIDGRRIAPAGVEGAPIAVDLSLVPSSLIQQYDILLDGASSVYGSDAVAGVVNAILRKDFDGIEVELYSTMPSQAGGDSNTLNVAWGKNTDRGFFGFGLEVSETDNIRLRDREWTAGCDQHQEIDENGNRRTQDQFYANNFNMTWDECALGSLIGRMSAPGFGSVYYIPGQSNTGIPNFNESSLFSIGIDTNSDGVNDIGSFRNFDTNGSNDSQNSDYFGKQEQISFMGYGETTLEGEMNITPYFEVLYGKRETTIRGDAAQLFPTVPANNPFNPCGVNGVDCGLAYDSLLDNPGFAAQVAGAFGLTPAEFRDFGIVDLYQGAIGPQSVLPIVAVDGDRADADVTVDQTRVVLGVKGDLPALNNWSFDASLSYSKSNGEVGRNGIRGDRLDFALGIDPNTGGLLAGGPCVADAGSPVSSDVSGGCVPVNLFAASLYNGGEPGDFATAAERNYLFDSRDFDTEYEQTIASLFFTGSLFEMPAGTVNAGFGLEFREDEINSIPDDVARDGLFFGFFSDGGAVGSKTTQEAYGEIELPLFANQPGITEMNLNLSGRLTKDEFYGSEGTYSAKFGYRPVDSLLLRATYGTSYRAPNLRENFLLAQTGFNNVFDPCAIPADALDPLSGGYDPALDDREANVLANCLATGIDPTMLNNNGFNTYSVEIASGGQTRLSEETSDSLSYGFSFEQPWFDAFDMALSATYFEIDVQDTIVEPSAGFISISCYFDEDGDGQNVNCPRITRDGDGFIDFIDAGFINRDQQFVSGLDLNLTFDQTVTIADRPVDLSADLKMTHPIEVSQKFTDDNGNPDFDRFDGEPGYAEWTGDLTLRADIDDIRLTWRTRYIGSMVQDADGIDEFDDTSGLSDTCLGPAQGDVLCRDIGFVDNYFVHQASVYYRGDTWTIGAGVSNLFDEAPPQVDGSEIFAANNTPRGLGYDTNGRTMFFNIAANF